MLDDTVEWGTFVSIAFFAGSKGPSTCQMILKRRFGLVGVLPEILSSLWHSASVETHNNSSNVLIAVLDIKIDLYRSVSIVQALRKEAAV